MSRRLLPLLLEILSPAAAIAAWWFWSADHNSIYFPALSDILSTFRKIWLFDRIWTDAVPSLERLLAGLTVAVAVGISGGLLFGLSPLLRRTFDPVVQFLRAIPPPALLPFGILVFGIGDGMKIGIIAIVCVWPILLNTIDGVAGIEPTLLETVRVYGVGRVDRIRLVILPAAGPQIFSGMRTGVAVSLIMMVISEMVASTNGLGYFILHAQRTFAITEMWSGIVFLGILGYLLNLAFSLVERRLLAWHRSYRQSILRAG